MKRAPFKLRSGNTPQFKQLGSSPTPFGIVNFMQKTKEKIAEKTKDVKENVSEKAKNVKEKASENKSKGTDWASIQKKAAAKDPRYGKMSVDEYKAEAQRQMASKKAGKGWDAMGVYDAEGNKKKEKKQDNKVTTEKNTDDGTGTTRQNQMPTTTGVEQEKKGKKIGGKIKDFLKKTAQVGVAALTGGLDAVYGTGKVMPDDSKLVKAAKEKKDNDKIESETAKKILEGNNTSENEETDIDKEAGVDTENTNTNEDDE